jgi:hypothetical protein
MFYNLQRKEGNTELDRQRALQIRLEHLGLEG